MLPATLYLPHSVALTIWPSPAKKGAQDQYAADFKEDTLGNTSQPNVILK